MMTKSVYDHIIPYHKDKRPHLYTENMQPEHGCGESLQFPILKHNLLLIWNICLKLARSMTLQNFYYTTFTQYIQ